jgi:hypothetical protein
MALPRATLGFAVAYGIHTLDLTDRNITLNGR